MSASVYGVEPLSLGRIRGRIGHIYQIRRRIGHIYQVKTGARVGSEGKAEDQVETR